jgi:hypothetical protein
LELVDLKRFPGGTVAHVYRKKKETHGAR